MGKLNRIFILVSFLFFTGLVPLRSQTSVPKDRFTLLTMPYNQRQTTLYKGQIQANAGYKFAIRSRKFDKDGNLIILKDEGTASVYHYYLFELRYGVTNFLELSAQTSYMKRGIRSVTENVISTSAEAVSINTVTETKGPGDILLLGSLRLPVEFRHFDAWLTGGAYVPSAKYEPEKPAHKVSSLASANTLTIDYKYKNRNGYGVPVWLLSGGAKLSLSRYSMEAGFTYRKPVGQGESIRWDEELTVDKTFAYSSATFGYLLNSSYDVSASLHYQPTGWFNISLNASWFHSEGGWTEYWGNKYMNRPESLVTIGPMLEIQISPSLTIYEVTEFPVTGNNSDGPFCIFITLSYNSFPFFR